MSLLKVRKVKKWEEMGRIKLKAFHVMRNNLSNNKPYRRFNAIAFLDLFASSVSFCGMDGNEIYPYLCNKNYYFFTCEGKEGEIIKCVMFDQIISSGFFNLALVDLTPENEWSDKNRTAHKDGDMVLRTVASIVRDFLNKNPRLTIYIESNTPAKRRLYNQVITNNLHKFSNNFQILGVVGNKTEQFKKNSLYDRFLIKKTN